MNIHTYYKTFSHSFAISLSYVRYVWMMYELNHFMFYLSIHLNFRILCFHSNHKIQPLAMGMRHMWRMYIVQRTMHKLSLQIFVSYLILTFHRVPCVCYITLKQKQCIKPKRMSTCKRVNQSRRDRDRKKIRDENIEIENVLLVLVVTAYVVECNKQMRYE